MPDLTIVPMRRRHLPAVVAIESRSNPHPWSVELFGSELRQANARCFVAVVPHSRVVGFGCLMTTGAEAHVTNLGVSPERRRAGVGRRLMEVLVDQTAAWGLDSMTLEVRAGNAAAQALYRSLGFESEGVRPRYYRDNGEDAVIMWRRGLADRAAGARS